MTTQNQVKDTTAESQVDWLQYIAKLGDDDDRAILKEIQKTPSFPLCDPSGKVAEPSTTETSDTHEKIAKRVIELFKHSTKHSKEMSDEQHAKRHGELDACVERFKLLKVSIDAKKKSKREEQETVLPNIQQ